MSESTTSRDRVINRLTPHTRELYSLMRKAGFLHGVMDNEINRTPRSDLSTMSNEALSEEMAYWGGAAARVRQCMGLLIAEKTRLKVDYDLELATVKNRLRKAETEKLKKGDIKKLPTQGELTDLAKADQAVAEKNRKLAHTEQTLAILQSEAEALDYIITPLSRTITLRTSAGPHGF